MTVRDGANHCLFSAKTFASGGTFDAARSADAEKLLALAAAAPELLKALDGIIQWWMESDGGDDMPVDLFDRAQAALKRSKGTVTRITSLSDIKEAVLAGKIVHWKTPAYQVICDSIGQWLIVCKSTNGCWGLTWADGVTMNEKPEDFFVGGAR